MAVALLTSPEGKADADGEGLAMAVELDLLPGSVMQPAAAKVTRTMISPSVVCLIVFILEYLVTNVYRHNRPLTQAVLTFRYLAPGVLALGEADAAGEGLAAGLGLFTGVLMVAGAVDGEGLAVVGEVELFTGSVAQPAANTIDDSVRSSKAMKLILFVFGVLIFFLIRARLKSEIIIARLRIGSNECSHRPFAGISGRSALKPSFSKSVLARLANAQPAGQRAIGPIGPISAAGTG
jgi:hypothetical protein